MEALIGFHREVGVGLKSLLHNLTKALVISNEGKVNPESPAKNQRDITKA